MARDVVLVDAGGTNIGSVCHALERLGVNPCMSGDADRIRTASHVILPGVGAAAQGMARLRNGALIDVLRALTQPVLGVCLGMQLLFEHSEEGDTECLGILPGRVRHVPGMPQLRVPHMGWNRLSVQRPDPLLAGLDQTDMHAYFVHSYFAAPDAHCLATATHGVPLSAVVRRGNVCGMQFHPERSAATGARLLANFLELEEVA